MGENPIWEIELFVDGPVTVRQHVRTTQQKGLRLDDPFYSDIEITKQQSGLKATVTARAPDHFIAYKAAVYFFGQMIDALTLAIHQPLYLGLTQGERRREHRHDVKRCIEQNEIENAFREAHDLRVDCPWFLRSLGWYRKGLTTDDPLDKFLAFWNAIEIVAGRDYQNIPGIDKERAKNGTKSQVWECFKALWGPCDEWPIIPRQDRWIDQSYEVRKNVAHGLVSISVHEIVDVAERLPGIEQVCFSFLCGWRQRFLRIDQHSRIAPLSVINQELLLE